MITDAQLAMLKRIAEAAQGPRGDGWFNAHDALQLIAEIERLRAELASINDGIA